MSVNWKKVAFWAAMFVVCIGGGFPIVFAIAAFAAYGWKHRGE